MTKEREALIDDEYKTEETQSSPNPPLCVFLSWHEMWDPRLSTHGTSITNQTAVIPSLQW
jgi:hypothetical protein